MAQSSPRPGPPSGAGSPATVTAVLDDSGHIRNAAPELGPLFGIRPQDLLGQPLGLLLAPLEDSSPAVPEPPSVLSELLETGHCWCRLRTGQAPGPMAEVSAIRLPDGSGTAIGVHPEPWALANLSTPLLESAPDGLVIADAEGTIVLANNQVEQLFGYPQAELIGQKVEILVPATLRTHHARLRDGYLRNAAARPMAIGKNLYAVRKDGTQFPADISLSWICERGTHLVSSWIRDVTERRRQDDDLIMLGGIVHSADDAVLGCDLAGRITSWNPSAERLFGYTEAEMRGRSPAVLSAPELLGELGALIAAIGRGERVEVHDGVRIRKDGSPVDVSISMSPIHDRQGTLVGAATVFRDITRNKSTERSLLAARDAAEASSQALEAFSYSVAHDLRAPLRAISGFGRLLDEGYGDRLDEEGRNCLAHVRASALEMGNLIEGLLHLAKVSHRELVFVPFDLSDCVQRILARLRSANPQRSVETRVEPGLAVHGDPVLLANVLENLVQNAWKFTGRRADARIEFGRDPSGYFVRDNGAGFDMKASGKLFGVFQRCHTTDEFEGTGVGLATVRRIVERHGGQIWAVGAVGEGAVFHFTLAAPGNLAAPAAFRA